MSPKIYAVAAGEAGFVRVSNHRHNMPGVRMHISQLIKGLAQRGKRHCSR